MSVRRPAEAGAGWLDLGIRNRLREELEVLLLAVGGVIRAESM